jgi:hypothetical protein
MMLRPGPPAVLGVPAWSLDWKHGGVFVNPRTVANDPDLDPFCHESDSEDSDGHGCKSDNEFDIQLLLCRLWNVIHHKPSEQAHGCCVELGVPVRDIDLPALQQRSDLLFVEIQQQRNPSASTEERFMICFLCASSSQFPSSQR